MQEADEKVRERRQVQKKQTRYTYVNGPMLFLGQQIVRQMQDAGYPAFIWCAWRSPERQQEYFDAGTSKARPWESPHQYIEAVDILHRELYWDASQDFWETLNACVEVVSEKYGVEFETGYDWGWDMAHIELKDWRTQKRGRKPTEQELWQRFEEVLPSVARQALKSASFPSELRKVSTLS